MVRYPAWKKQEVKKKWQNIIAVFITVVFFKLDKSLYLESGKSDKPLVILSELINNHQGEDLSNALALSFGADIRNYIFLKDEISLNEDNVEKIFKNFVSFTTPVVLLLKGTQGQIQSTNITRIDMIKLWWQVKDISIENIKLVDFTNLNEEVIFSNNKKVLGADETSWHFEVSQYLENRFLNKENIDLEIQNGSLSSKAGELAAEFAQSGGFHVTKLNVSEEETGKTMIITHNKNSYEAGYLASIFDCDIFGKLISDDNLQMTLIVGKDFASKYF